MTMADNKDKKVLNAPDKREQNDARIGSAEREGQVTKAQPKGNVPALRFPEFSGEWEHILNKELLNPVSEKNRDKTITLILSASQTEGMIERSNIGIDIKFDENSVKNYKIVRAGDYVVHLRSFQGGFAFSELTGICSPAYTILRPNKQLQYGFLRAYFMSKKFIDSLRLVTYGIRDGKSISVEEWMQLYTNIPSDKEQDKIIKLFNILDERITLQNKIIEDLKKLKSAIVEALFCAPKESMPAKRLSPYSKEWKLIKLSDICQRVQTKNTGSKCRQVLTITAQYGLVNQEDFFNKTVASENLEGYYLLRKGDFAYNKSYSGDYAWGAVKRLDRYEQGVLSPLYICFRPDTVKVDADYLAHYFESKKWHKGIADIAGEGARNHGLLNISVIDFFNTIHRIPDLDEQKDIAQVLNLLSFKLSCEQHVMQSLTMQRRYLLQKMFI